MTERPVKTVGRCIVCGDMIVEVADVQVQTGTGFRVQVETVRRCGCGDFRRDE